LVDETTLIDVTDLVDSLHAFVVPRAGCCYRVSSIAVAERQYQKIVGSST
jgi:hypothetical protein